MLPTDDDNTILSRLLREQRINSNSNLVRIEEETRSPRGKTIESGKTMETDEKKGNRSIIMQTEFSSEVSTKREKCSERYSKLTLFLGP